MTEFMGFDVTEDKDREGGGRGEGGERGREGEGGERGGGERSPPIKDF